MAIRFLDTNYYKSSFVRGLKGSLKSLYSFIILECDGAGIWHLDLPAASLYIGFEITQQEFDNHFVATGKAVNISKNRFFFPDFIEHQYPKGLQANNPAQKNFIETLKKFDLIDENLKLKKGSKEGLKSPLSNSNSNGNSQSDGKSNSNGSDEKFIIPQMCTVWYENFKTYTSDKQSDFDGMGKILNFISRQANVKNISDSDTQIKILNTLQLVADEVNREPFWVNKPIKSIANNIQEFYNKIKNPVENGSAKSTSKNNGATAAGVQAILEKRFAQKG